MKITTNFKDLPLWRKIIVALIIPLAILLSIAGVIIGVGAAVGIIISVSDYYTIGDNRNNISCNWSDNRCCIPLYKK
jgi:hypothetical protein